MRSTLGRTTSERLPQASRPRRALPLGILCALLLALLAPAHASSHVRPLHAPPRVQDAAPTTPPTTPDLRARLAGAWESTDHDNVTILDFQGERCVLAWRSQQLVFDVTYDDASITRTPTGQGPVLTEVVAIVGDELTLTYPDGNTRTYRKLDHAPHRTRIEPFELGTTTPDEAAMAALVEDLLAREGREQDVRERLNALMTTARQEGRLDDPAAYQAFMQGEEVAPVMAEMTSVDTDNTRFLIGLISEHGWIDAERFGRPANHAAFLIVQHSSHLGLMLTALPLIEAEARQRPELGQDFALLYDRTHLSLGEMQRYGTQLVPDEDGTLRVHQLEDPDGVDARRESVGMGPLDEYLDIFRARGNTVVVGDDAR